MLNVDSNGQLVCTACNPNGKIEQIGDIGRCMDCGKLYELDDSSTDVIPEVIPVGSEVHPNK